MYNQSQLPIFLGRKPYCLGDSVHGWRYQEISSNIVTAISGNQAQGVKATAHSHTEILLHMTASFQFQAAFQGT